MKTTYFLIDTLNNNKVVKEFSSKKEADKYLNQKEHSESWEDDFETFEDFKDQFFLVDSKRMEEAVREKGSRVKEYWT